MGLIAVSDVEIYFMQQKEDYSALINGIAYDQETGIIQKFNYMSYVNLNADMVYNDYEQTSVIWLYIQNMQKYLCCIYIEDMLKNNLPVVFAYYTTEEHNSLTLYKELDYAINEIINEGDKIL